jgi:hypothetical protein
MSLILSEIPYNPKAPTRILSCRMNKSKTFSAQTRKIHAVMKGIIKFESTSLANETSD